MWLAFTWTLWTLQSPLPPDPALREAMLAAQSAVEGDSVQRVRARWEREAAADPRDPVSRLGLGYLSLHTYRFDEADRRFGALLAAAGASGELAGYAGLGLARSALGRGNAAAADSLLGPAVLAARGAGSRLLEAETLIFHTLTSARIRGPALALPLLARADSLISTTDPTLRSRATCVRSQLSRSWNLVAAVTMGLEGAAEARAAGARRTEAFCLAVTGWAVALRGNGDSAFALFRRADRLQEQTRDRSGRAATLQWWGYFLFDVGHYGEARTVVNRSLAESQASGNLSPAGYSHIILARLTFVTGEMDEVATHIARAESLFTRQGDQSGHYILAGPTVERARAVGDTAAARVAAERYVREAATWGGIWPVEAHRSLAMVLTDAGEWLSARAQLDSALAAARVLGSAAYVASVEQDLGVLALRRGDPGTARRILERLAGNHRPEQAVFGHYTRIQLAGAYLQSGDVTRAATTALAAADDLDRWRAGLEDRRLLQTAFDLRPLENPSFAMAEIVSGLASAGREELAFDLAERRRARQLLDRIVLADGLQGSRPQADRSRASAATLPDIVRAIPDDSTAIVEYVRGQAGSATTVFVVTRAGLRATRITPAPELGRQVRRFIGLLEGGAPADSLGRQLGARLIEPVLAGLPAAVVRLVIVPDVDLHGLPFEALRVNGGLVIERFAVSYAPSASVVARLWQRPRHTAAGVTLLSFGDPRFADRTEPGSQAEHYLSAFEGSGGLGRLRATAGEARTVAGYADQAEVRLRGDASEAGLKRAGLARYRVVHLATHALVDDRSIARTALALAPGDGEDGFMSPAEMSELDFAADLLVLSACRTGRGPVAGGEGVQGLAAPALEAGARSVLASGWLVGDKESGDFMKRYYGHLARGHNLGDALRLTKIELLRAGAPAGVWASFSLVGDPHSTLPLRRPPPSTPWLALSAAAIAIAAALAYGVMRRRRGREGASSPSGSSPTTSQR
jgi:tetratricopeptide (TPR) repeat protein